MEVKLFGGSDAVNGTTIDAAVRGQEVRVRERIDDGTPVAQYAIHKYTVSDDKAYWVSTDFLGRRKRIVDREWLIPEIVVYDRQGDPATVKMVRQLEIELAKNKPVKTL